MQKRFFKIDTYNSRAVRFLLLWHKVIYEINEKNLLAWKYKTGAFDISAFVVECS